MSLTKKKNDIDFDEVTKMWTRVCPNCNNVVFHKNKNKCILGKKYNKLCTKCNRKSLGKKNAKTDACPICNVLIRITHADQSELKLHAESHQLTSEELWSIKFSKQPTYCKCGCGEKPEWLGWWGGYNEFVFGHQSKLAQKGNRGKNWREDPYWKGKTKENDEEVANRGNATSIGRKLAFDEGRMTCWSKGLTKENNESLARQSEDLKRMYELGEIVPWAAGLNKENSEKVRNMAEKISKTHRDINLRKQLDDQKKRSLDNVTSMIEQRNILKYVSGYENYVNAGSSLVVHCTKCDQTYEERLYKMFNGICRKCSPTSQPQFDIDVFVRSLGFTTISNSRSIIPPQEIDIFVPEKNFGIEFNGLYWHNECGKTNSYHDDKSQAAKHVGINLLHIFNDEWNFKQPIVRSMIAAKLGVSQNNVGARKCEIIELDYKTKKSFFNENHIDGDVQSTCAYGLIFENNVVAALSLRKPRQKKYDGYYEVARFAQKVDTHVAGGLSKLTKHALKQINSPLMTYVDTRMGSLSHAWEKSGWSKIDETVTRWWWTDCHNRFDRFKYKADKSHGLTEKQVAEEAGVVKIYGCRNLVYEIKP